MHEESGKMTRFFLTADALSSFPIINPWQQDESMEHEIEGRRVGSIFIVSRHTQYLQKAYF
jgi:hypothetical protein